MPNVKKSGALTYPGPPWAISTACCGSDLYLNNYSVKLSLLNVANVDNTFRLKSTIITSKSRHFSLSIYCKYNALQFQFLLVTSFELICHVYILCLYPCLHSVLTCPLGCTFTFFLSETQQTTACLDRLIVNASRSHTIIHPHAVELLWTSDQKPLPT